MWVVTKYTNVHSCAIDTRVSDVRGAATARTIAHMVKDEILSPPRIREMLERVFGIKISYWKAWKAKEIAQKLIRGSAEESYLSISSYLWLIERENPGTWGAMGYNWIR